MIKINVSSVIVSDIMLLSYLGDSPDSRKVTYQLNMEDEKWQDVQIQRKI